MVLSKVLLFFDKTFYDAYTYMQNTCIRYCCFFVIINCILPFQMAANPEISIYFYVVQIFFCEVNAFFEDIHC